jgi:hypothetical protein
MHQIAMSIKVKTLKQTYIVLASTLLVLSSIKELLR